MASMRLAELLEILEGIAPTRHADAWDNAGLLVGDPLQEVRRVLLCVDYTPEVALEGKGAGVEAVVAYHPPIFEGLKRLDHDGVVADAVRRGVALWSPHTALDVVTGGTNDLLADVVGLDARRTPLRALAPPAPPEWGHGRIGLVPASAREELLSRIKRELSLTHLLVAGPLTGTVTRVAVAAGAGGSLLDEALSQGAHFFLTGELRHHDALRAARLGVTVACTLHSNSERACLQRISRRLQRDAPSLVVKAARSDRDPFVLA
jgi:dinuclear metal center YbgI/SA1388 family protein